jgi:signal transduction histidine kinase
MLNFDYSSVKLFFDALSGDSDVLAAELLDNNYTVKMHTDLNRLGEISKAEIDDEDFNTTVIIRNFETERLIRYEFYSPVLAETERIGIFHITLTNKTYLNVIRLAWIKMIGLGVFSLFVGIIGALILGNQMSRPIKELVTAAESLSGENFKWNAVIDTKDEVGKLALAFKNMTERLDKSVSARIKSEKMAVVGQLSSVIAHEIRNPLEPIKGAAELFKIYYPGEKQIMQLAGIIQEEVSRLISFIDNFLDFARPREPDFRDVDLNLLVDKTLILLEKMISDKNIEVSTSLMPDLPLVKGDDSMLKQVFLNIILNSIQAIDRKHGQISVTTDSRNGIAKLNIKDNGRGINQEFSKKIFDPFFTTKAEGAGTGLTTCQQIIDQHGGEINIKSESGKWTMVQILLPLTQKRDIKINE